MATKICVRGLNKDTTEETLKEHFSRFGTVDAISIAGDKVNKTLNIAYLAMPSAEEAQKAISGLHTKELDERKLSICQAKPGECQI